MSMLPFWVFISYYFVVLFLSYMLHLGHKHTDTFTVTFHTCLIKHILILIQFLEPDLSPLMLIIC